MKYNILLFALLIFSCSNQDNGSTENQATNLVTSVAYKQINGVNPNLLSLDIYSNSDTETKKPIVIYVHGGGWSIGDKVNKIENKRNLFQSLNYVFISVNYRLSPFPYELNNPNRIMYPTHNYDVADAIKWVVSNIDQYGGNPNKIVLLGHSAGAHLVALTGTNNDFLAHVGLSFSNIKGICAIDTEGYNVLTKVENNSALYLNAFGDNMNANIDASPIYNIQNGISYPNFFIAKRGGAQRITFANEFIESLENNGVLVSQVEGSIYNHEEINNAIGKLNETLITNPLKVFLEECFE